jgi:iron(III) transport system substrate-binding protein
MPVTRSWPSLWTALLTFTFPLLTSCHLDSSSSESVVVVYASQDQVYAEPVLRLFEQETGITTQTVFDSEAVKTVGLVQRLLAEVERPQCDVFWSNEELRTHQLASRQVLRLTNGWAAFGYRSRRLIINTNLFPGSSFPHRVSDLTNQLWRGKISLAYPLFGSTATHFLALRHHWGPAAWEPWCRALASNNPFLEAGNSHVPARLARGEAWIGLTDSDDVDAARRGGLAVGHVLPVSEESLLIRNSVAVIRNAPHPQSAQRLFQFLQRPDIQQQLVKLGALEGTDASSLKTGTLQPDWAALVQDLEPAMESLKTIFLQ